MARQSHLSPLALSAQLRTFIAKAAALIVWVAETPFLFVDTNWARKTFKLRAYMRATSGIAYGRIFDVTDAAEVVQVQTASAAFAFITSPEAVLIDAHVYQVEFGTTDTDGGERQTAVVYQT